MNSVSRIAVNRYKLLEELKVSVNLCEKKYCYKKELATEEDTLISKLCYLWEDILTFGLRTNKAINDFTDLFKNVQDIVTRNTMTKISFWDFCKLHLSFHEKERFESLTHVTTKDGKVRSLIRASLNEHSLERYICMWLNDPKIMEIYESTSIMVDTEATVLLPKLANNLNTILFAINIDSPTLNFKNNISVEPVIYAPSPTITSKKSTAIRRNILTLDEENEVEDALETLDSFTNSSKEELNALDELINEPDLTKENKIFSNSDDINIANQKRSNATEESDLAFSDIKEYIISLGGKIFYPNDLNDKEYLESDSSPNLSKSASYSGTNLSNSFSSLIVTGTNINDSDKIRVLEDQLKYMRERCTFLENRVAQLSLENHRLQKLKHYIDNDFGNFNVTIPKVSLISNGNSKHYVYEIHLTSREQESWIISKRYSDFYKLYQDMSKNHKNLVKAIDFPPKKKIGNLDASFVEERRQRLQIFLRNLLKTLPELSLCTSKEELEAEISFFK